MKVTYFGDTDTLHIELRSGVVARTRELDENTLVDLDDNGLMCGITIEHARDRVDLPRVLQSNDAGTIALEPVAAA